MESRYLTSAILPKRLSCSASRGPALVFAPFLSLRSAVNLDHLENDTLMSHVRTLLGTISPMALLPQRVCRAIKRARCRAPRRLITALESVDLSIGRQYVLETAVSPQRAVYPCTCAQSWILARVL